MPLILLFQLPSSLFNGSTVHAVHFGNSIHYMARGMSRQEVANMFTRGYVCFKAWDPQTGKVVGVLPTAIANLHASIVHKYPQSDGRCSGIQERR